MTENTGNAGSAGHGRAIAIVIAVIVAALIAAGIAVALNRRPAPAAPAASGAAAARCEANVKADRIRLAANGLDASVKVVTASQQAKAK